MKSAKETLIQEAICLPIEISHKQVINIQISFEFADGSMHHVKPSYVKSKKLARDCLKYHTGPEYKRWEFLGEEDTMI